MTAVPVAPMQPASAGAGRAGSGMGIAGTGVRAPAAGLALSATGLVIMAMLGTAFVALFQHFFYVQNFQAMTNADWSHAYLVPLVSVYLLWSRRADLTAIRPEVFWPGVIPIVVGIACYVLFQLGQAFNSHMLRGFSMILCLFGIVLLLLGPRAARAMLLPILYLVFAVTLAERIMREFTVPLRFIATEGSFSLLSFLGVSADRHGNILEIQTGPGTSVPLNIADACAGMRMVIAFVALGAAVAIIGGKRWWQRIVLLLLAVPVAVLMNVVRVAALGLLTLWDPKLAQGESHMLVGYVFLLPAFGIYMAAVWAMDKIIIEPTVKKPPPPHWWRPGPVRWRVVASPAVLVCMGILSASALALPMTIASLGVHLRKLPIYAEGDRQLREVPRETASWRQVGEDFVESSEAIEELGTRNYLTRQYALKGGKPGEVLQLHVAYYTGMIDAVPHVPERCMVAGGWNIKEGGTRTLPLALDRSTWREHEVEAMARAGWRQAKLPNQFVSSPGLRVTLPIDVDELAMRVTEFEDSRGVQRLFAGYFFIANGGVTSSAEGVRVKAFDFKNDYAFYCKVQVSATLESPEELARRATSLMSELLPEIMRCVPDWSMVERGEYPPDHPRRAARRAN